MQKYGLDLVTLTPFSRSDKGLDCWKMASLHPISRRNGWILTKLAQLYCCDMKKNWLDFGDLDLFFKVTGGLILENGFSAPYLQNEWIDFDQTCTTILLREGKELIRFWWPWPMFKVTGGGGGGEWSGGTGCLKMAFLHPISRMNGRTLT